MLSQIKNIKVYHAFLIAFAISILCVVFKSTEIYTDNSLANCINCSILFFIASGIAYRFQNITTEVRKTEKKTRLAYMLVFALAVFYFFSDKITWQDDKVFETYLTDISLKDYLLMRYEKWTSRFIIESILTALVKSNIYVWRIFTTILVTVIAECAIDLFISEKNKKFSFVVYLLALLTIPYLVFCDAGWVATTTNYLWPLAAFMPICLVLKKIFENKKISLFEKIQTGVLTLVATNIEPLVLCVLGFSIALFLYNTYTTKDTVKGQLTKLDNTFLLIIAISFVSLLLTLLAPGNAYRTVSETGTWYPEFADFSLIEKVELGFVSTMPFFYANTIYVSNLMYPTNFVMLLLMLFVCIKLGKDKKYKTLALQALGIIILLFGQAHIIAQTFGKQLNKSWYVLANAKIGQLSDFDSTYIYLEILIYIAVFAALLVGIFQALGKEKKAILACVVLLAGFCTRLVMGFSPTVYASGTRTFLFTIVAILIVTVIVIDDLISEEKNKKFTLLAFISSMIYVFLLMPEMKVGTEFENKTEIVDISELRAYPVHENKEIRNAFRIDANNYKYQPEDEDILDFDSDKGMFLTGWAYDIETKDALSGMYIVMGDYCVKVNYGSTRKDVANAFKVDKKVGFAIKLPKELFLKSKNMIESMDFYLVSSSEEFKYDHFTFKVRYPNLEEKSLSGMDWESGLHIEYCNDKQQKDGDHNLLLDKEKGIIISGWAIDFANKTKLGGIQFSIGDTTINAEYGNERQDVADFFKMKDKELGFKIEIPAEALNKRKDVSDIGIVLVSPNLDFKYEPIIYKIKR